MSRSVGFLVMLPLAVAHFNIVYPPTWQDANGAVGTASGMQCQAGCTRKHAPGEAEPMQGCNCEWYTNWTFVKTATIPQDSPLRTYQDTLADGYPIGDWTCLAGACRPWRAPGQAKVSSPCGIDGGNLNGCPPGSSGGGGCAGGGYGHGPDARTTTFPGVVTTKWKAGGLAEVKWGITANHGGGYSYRLCPKPAGGNKDLTEECFQETVLRAVGNHTAVFPNGTQTPFPAMRTTTGTFPAGSQWTRNPIPACSGPGGGSLVGSGSKCTGYQFPPPLGANKVPSEMGGFGTCDGDGKKGLGGIFYWHVVDHVQVPANLTSGEYVLSLRWDSEQTPQVWNSCADIMISNDAVLV